ncbi:Cytochrome P450 CYP5293A1 [Beauveria bassiana ARSEF 2860]|uniref:Cytochrome P450 CYP5293A1 n=1 Tax=Beauveria bassiana (strain ARSEF 2860) TaxID=655819 RepID=J4UMQ5_BEAB2|nr:Cytochrome P450 CYP5293A1 [Beauveria bassiana ARSEF 2860]EJP66212.1 Cytochrome P450 CYP5293A1 [Beauveria bassiana ARSEF 2860]
MLSCSKLTKTSQTRKPFTDANGRKVKMLKEDTRYTRFSHGPQVSEAGRAIAGDEPFLIRNGPFQELVISQPDQLKEFCRKDAKDHTKPTNMNLGDGFGQLLGGAVGVQAGKKWTTMRAHFDPEFSHKASMSMVPLYNNEAIRWLTELAQPSSSSCSSTPSTAGGFVRNIAGACRLLPFRLIGLVTYGEAFDDKLYQQLVELNEIHDKLMLDAFFGKWNASKLYNMLPTASRRRMQSFQRTWESINDAVILRAKTEGLRCPAEVIHRGVEAGDMSKREFLQTVDELLFTNIDVTSTAVACLLLNVAENPGFQESLRQEMAQMKSDPSYDVQQYIAKRDVLLHYAILESLRMRPVLWFSLPEKTAIDKEIGGYYVPSGSTVVIDWKRLNTAPVVWGDDSEMFRPERFAGMSPLSYRHAFLRFGFSRERCLGKNISDIILKTILMATLESYTLKPSKHSAVRKDRFTVTLDDEVEFTPIKAV